MASVTKCAPLNEINHRTYTETYSMYDGKNTLKLAKTNGISAKSANGPSATQYLAHLSICSPSSSIARIVLNAGYTNPTHAQQHLVLNTDVLTVRGVLVSTTLAT